jgi:hypothetical protein
VIVAGRVFSPCRFLLFSAFAFFSKAMLRKPAQSLQSLQPGNPKSDPWGSGFGLFAVAVRRCGALQARFERERPKYRGRGLARPGALGYAEGGSVVILLFSLTIMD